MKGVNAVQHCCGVMETLTIIANSHIRQYRLCLAGKICMVTDHLKYKLVV